MPLLGPSSRQLRYPWVKELQFSNVSQTSASCVILWKACVQSLLEKIG